MVEAVSFHGGCGGLLGSVEEAVAEFLPRFFFSFGGGFLAKPSEGRLG
jgi:hypothetical protein